MNENKAMLDQAIKYFGMNDIVTNMLINRVNKEEEATRKELDEWNKQYNHQLDFDNGEIYSVETGETIGEV